MTITEERVTLRKLEAGEGMVITDIDTQCMRAKVLYLGCEESAEHFVEIDEDTPLPEEEEGSDEV